MTESFAVWTKTTRNKENNQFFSRLPNQPDVGDEFQIETHERWFPSHALEVILCAPAGASAGDEHSIVRRVDLTCNK